MMFNSGEKMGKNLAISVATTIFCDCAGWQGIAITEGAPV